MWFDQPNDSQKEHLPNVIDEPPLDEVIRSIATGEIKPIEANASYSSDDDPSL